MMDLSMITFNNHNENDWRKFIECSVGFNGDTYSVMVIIIVSGLGYTSSNPGRGYLHFT